jgi:hypothetical protein
LSQQLRALAAAQVNPDVAGSSPAVDTVSDVLQRLQAGIISLSSKVQDAMARSTLTAGQEADAGASAAAPTASAQPAAALAATLAAVRLVLGPDAMSLLPVLLVTAATAVAGLVLAACIAGFTGLLDSRRRGGLRARLARLLCFRFGASAC